MLFRFQEWYGWDVACLHCGESWGDGERIERPFAPGWRKRRVKSCLAWIDRNMDYERSAAQVEL